MAAAALSALCRPGTCSDSAKPSRRRRDRHVARAAVVQPEVGLIGGAVQDHPGVAPLPGAPGQGQRAGVVRAGHQDAVGGQQRREAVEGCVDGFGGAVVVQVVRFDVGDHGDLRAVVQEGPVGFVGFGDEDARTCRAPR